MTVTHYKDRCRICYLPLRDVLKRRHTKFVYIYKPFQYEGRIIAFCRLMKDLMGIEMPKDPNADLDSHLLCISCAERLISLEHSIKECRDQGSILRTKYVKTAKVTSLTSFPFGSNKAIMQGFSKHSMLSSPDWQTLKLSKVPRIMLHSKSNIHAATKWISIEYNQIRSIRRRSSSIHKSKLTEFIESKYSDNDQKSCRFSIDADNCLYRRRSYSDSCVTQLSFLMCKYNDQGKTKEIMISKHNKSINSQNKLYKNRLYCIQGLVSDNFSLKKILNNKKLHSNNFPSSLSNLPDFLNNDLHNDSNESVYDDDDDGVGAGEDDEEFDGDQDKEITLEYCDRPHAGLDDSKIVEQCDKIVDEKDDSNVSSTNNHPSLLFKMLRNSQITTETSSNLNLIRNQTKSTNTPFDNQLFKKTARKRKTCNPERKISPIRTNCSNNNTTAIQTRCSQQSNRTDNWNSSSSSLNCNFDLLGKENECNGIVVNDKYNNQSLNNNSQISNDFNRVSTFVYNQNDDDDNNIDDSEINQSNTKTKNQNSKRNVSKYHLRSLKTEKTKPNPKVNSNYGIEFINSDLKKPSNHQSNNVDVLSTPPNSIDDLLPKDFSNKTEPLLNTSLDQQQQQQQLIQDANLKDSKLQSPAKLDPRKCEECNKLLFTYRQYILHRQGHCKCINTCWICNVQCEDVRKHLTTIHSTDYTPSQQYHCQQCQSSFENYADLHAHAAEHFKSKPYECPICLKRFSQQGNLSCHLRIHSGVKPFICNICGKTFRHSNSLRRHLRTVHNSKKIPPNLSSQIGIDKLNHQATKLTTNDNFNEDSFDILLSKKLEQVTAQIIESSKSIDSKLSLSIVKREPDKIDDDSINKNEVNSSVAQLPCCSASSYRSTSDGQKLTTANSYSSFQIISTSSDSNGALKNPMCISEPNLFIKTEPSCHSLTQPLFDFPHLSTKISTSSPSSSNIDLTKPGQLFPNSICKNTTPLLLNYHLAIDEPSNVNKTNNCFYYENGNNSSDIYFPNVQSPKLEAQNANGLNDHSINNSNLTLYNRQNNGLGQQQTNTMFMNQIEPTAAVAPLAQQNTNGNNNSNLASDDLFILKKPRISSVELNNVHSSSIDQTNQIKNVNHFGDLIKGSDRFDESFNTFSISPNSNPFNLTTTTTASNDCHHPNKINHHNEPKDYFNSSPMTSNQHNSILYFHNVDLEEENNYFNCSTTTPTTPTTKLSNGRSNKYDNSSINSNSDNQLSPDTNHLVYTSTDLNALNNKGSSVQPIRNASPSNSLTNQKPHMLSSHVSSL